MGALADAFKNAFRDFVNSGVPASGFYQVEKSVVRALGALIESQLQAGFAGLVIGDAVFAATRTALYAMNPTIPEGTNGVAGVVYADPDPTRNGVYIHATPGTGAANWPKADFTLPSEVLGDIALLQGLVEALSDDVDDLKNNAIANLSPGVGNGVVENVTVGEVVTPTLRLVQTGGHAGTKDAFSRFYYISTPAATNTVKNITLKIDDGAHLPLVPWDDNDFWPIGGLPTTGKMFVMADNGRYRVFSPYGATFTVAEKAAVRRAGSYYLGAATVVQNESGVTIYTFVNDDVPTGTLADGRTFTGDIPETNEIAKAKIQILRSNGEQVTGKVEIQYAAPRETIRARGMPVGRIQFTATGSSGGLFLLLGGSVVGGDLSFDEISVAAMRNALTSDDAEDPLALSSAVTELRTRTETNLEATRAAAAAARAAVGAGLAASTPGLLGVGYGYATTITVGSVTTAHGALTPDDWADESFELGPFIRIDGAAAQASPQVVAQPDVIFFEEGLRYEVTFVLARLDEGTNGGDLVRLGAQFMKGDFSVSTSVTDGRVEVYSDKPEISDGVVTIRRTFSYDGEGVDFPIPADAKCGRAYGLFNGNTPVTAFIIAKLEEQVEGGAADVIALTGRVTRAESVLETVPREVETLSSKTVTQFSDGEGRGTGRVVNTDDGVAWDLPRLLNVTLPGGTIIREVETLALKTAMAFTDADGRDAAGGISEELAALVTATAARAASLEARADQLEHGVVNRRHLARTGMLTAVLNGGDVSFATLSIAIMGDSKSERAGWARTMVKAARKKYGNSGAGALRLFNATLFPTAEDGQTFSNPGSPTTGVSDRSYVVTTTGTWTLKGPGDDDSGTPPANSVFLTSGTATAAASVTVTAKAGLTTQTSVKLYYTPASGASCRYRVNAGAWTTLDLSTGYVATLGASIAASDVFVIEWVSGSVELSGLRLLNGSSGVVVDKIAKSGSRLVQHWAAIAQTDGFAAQWQDMKPDLVIMPLGTNDDATAEAFAVALTNLITRLRALVPWAGELGLDIVVVAPAVWIGANGLRMLEYQAAMKSVAAANRCAFMNLQDAWPLGPSNSTSTYASYWDGGKHETNPFGMSASAGAFLSILSL